MNVLKALTIARDLMHWHGVGNYALQLDRSLARMGLCKYGKLISLSARLVADNSEEHVIDTILHEIAHALAYETYKAKGHGELWQLVCTQIGAKPERCYDASVVRHYRYSAVCCCGRSYHRNRLSRFLVYSCVRCQSRLVWKKG